MPSDAEPDADAEPQTESEPVNSEELPDPDPVCICGSCEFQEFTFTERYVILFIQSSVSDPYHFDADPDPRIRIRDDGSGS